MGHTAEAVDVYALHKDNARSYAFLLSTEDFKG